MWKVLNKAMGSDNNTRHFPQTFNIDNKLTPKISYDEDGISTKLLKMTIDIFTVPSTHIAYLTF